MEGSPRVCTSSVADQLDAAMPGWQSDLTRTLKTWIDKGLLMTAGELILACANLGVVVELWLKFFCSVYSEDYCNNPITNDKGKMIEPEKA